VQNYGFYLRNRNFTALKVTIINYLQLKQLPTLKFVIILRFEVLIANAR
jgi:hypothetical protein